MTVYCYNGYMSSEQQRGVPRASERLSELLADRRKLDQDEQIWRNRVSAYFHSVRTLNSMTQEELAHDLGISQVYLSNIERGERLPSGDVLGRMQSLLKKEDDGNQN